MHHIVLISNLQILWSMAPFTKRKCNQKHLQCTHYIHGNRVLHKTSSNVEQIFFLVAASCCFQHQNMQCIKSVLKIIVIKTCLSIGGCPNWLVFDKGRCFFFLGRTVAPIRWSTNSPIHQSHKMPQMTLLSFAHNYGH